MGVRMDYKDGNVTFVFVGGGREARLDAAIRSHIHDGHVYGSRPCETCRKVTAALGEPFGCDLFRKRKAEAVPICRQT